MRRKVCALMMILVLPLSACGGKDGGGEAEKALAEIRGKYLEMTGCSGHAELTADYGQRVYAYGLDFTWQREGETLLTLTAPEVIAGTTAHIAAGETALEYDGVMLETGPLNAAGLAPVDAEESQRLHVICRDPESEPGTGTEADLWFDGTTGALLRGEISDGGMTVIQCDISDFGMDLPSED